MSMDVHSTNTEGGEIPASSLAQFEIYQAMAENKLSQMIFLSGKIEGRIAVKKFMGTALVNCCNGPYHSLDCVRCTNSAVQWVLLSTPSTTSLGGAAAISSTSGSLFSKKSKKQKSSETISVQVGRNLALSVYASRIVHFIQESARLSGNSSGSGYCSSSSQNGMESYIRSIWDVNVGVVRCNKSGSGNDKEGASASTNASESGTVVDISPQGPTSRERIRNRAEGSSNTAEIFNITMVVMQLMLLTHQQCLRDIALDASCSVSDSKPPSELSSVDEFGFELATMLAPKESFSTSGNLSAKGKIGSSGSETSKVGFVLVNEEEIECNSIVREYANFNPLMHKTINTLVRCVSSSHSSMEQNDSKILYAITSALTLKCSSFEQNREEIEDKIKTEEAKAKTPSSFIL